MIVHPNIHCKSPKRIDRQGIKAVSLDANDQRKLHVNFFNPVDDPRLTDASNYQITGGERVQVNVISAKIDDSDKRQTILSLDNVGDFSTYTLHLIQDTSSLYVDPFFSEKEFSFKIYEDSDFDCKKHETVLSSSEEDGDDNDGGDGEEGGFKEIPISIDYMAKDYESFKSALLDLIPTKAPFWTDLSEPDLGISLIELFSHIADILSYYQDRVGNEAFLGTAQNRFSIKSHLSLIDYRLQNGIAAETFLRFTTSKETLINRGTKVSSRDEEIIFETDKDILIKPEHNKMQPYDWNNNNTQLQCLLPKGSSSLLLSVDPSKTYLKSGDLLLFEQQNFNGEFIREVVRLSKDPLIVPSPYYSPVHTTLPSTTEPVFTIIGITPDSNAIGVPITIPLITATFSKPVKISTISQSTVKVRKGISANNISGIVAVAVNGKTINFKPMAPLSPNSSYNVIIEAGIQEQDGQGNTITQPKTWSFTTGTLLTLIEWYGELKNDYDISRTTIYGNIVKASNGKSVVENIKGESLMVSGSLEEPQISLSHFPLSYHLPSEVIGGKKADIVKPLSSLAVFVDNERWIEVESLLESKQFDKHYEVSVDEEGLAKITFGNGTLGMKPSMNSELLLRYRVGTGTKGNVGSNVPH